MSQSWNQKIGRWGEEVAVRYCESLGYKIICRNWRCEVGEIDIIAQDGNTIVALEVKTRSNHKAGLPFEAITPQKLQRLQKLLAIWCSKQKKYFRELRIDTVGIIGNQYRYSLDYLRGVN